MSYMKWTSDLELGIEVIDNQHRRIVEYMLDFCVQNRVHTEG